jgi:iron complex outermembrane receptor protein
MRPVTRKFAAFMGSASLFTLAHALSAHSQQIAQGQAAPAQGSTEVPEQVLVTGSLIHGAAAVGVPVTNLGVQDLTETGAVSLGDLFRSVPQANVAPGPSAVNSGGHQERETRVNIRGLDATGPRSLLLIDGVRFPPQADGLCAIDPSIIPALALDRVDILADGASATYGSSAIAGVVNVILKRNFDGAITLLHVQQPTDGGGTQYQASQLFGRTWDGGDVTLTYEWTDEQAIKGNKHSKFTMDFTPWGLENPFVPIGAMNPGVVSTGAPVIPTTVPGGSGAVPFLVDATCTNCFSIPRGTGGNWVPGGGGVGPIAPASAATFSWPGFIANAANAGANNYIDPLSGTGGWEQGAQQKNSVVGTFDQRLWPNVSFFFSGFYTNRRVQEMLPSFGGQGLSNYIRTVSVPTLNPYYPTGAPAGLRVSYDFALEVPPSIPAWEISARYQFGLNLDLPYSWSGQIYESRSLEDVGFVRHLVSTGAINAALGQTVTVNGVPTTKPATVPYLNVFCDPRVFQCNSPTTLAYISGESGIEAHYTVDEKAARFDGPLFDLPGGQVKAAIGGVYDSDNPRVGSGNNTTVPGNPPLNQFFTYDSEPYHIWAGFVQVDVPIFGDNFNIPLVRKLDLEGSWRYDNYGGNAALTGTTRNPKIAFTWLIDETVGATVRGSWGTSFRFANVGEFSNVASPTDQSANIAGSGQSIAVACAANGQPTPGGAAAALFAAGFGCGSTPGGIAYGGGPEAVLRQFVNASTNQVQTREGGTVLAPEKATNYSIGFELAPQIAFLRGLDIQATWYSVKINGVLNGFLGAQTSTGLADPTQRFHFILPSDVGCPVSANANPTSCAPFQTMVRAALLDPNADSDITQLSKVFWLNDSGTTNAGFLHVSGVDWNVSYDYDAGDLGAWNAGVTGTYYLHRWLQLAPGGTVIDAFHQDLNPIGGVAQNGVETLPRMIYRARLGWSKDAFSATLFWNHQSHYYEILTAAPPNVNNQCTAAGGKIGGGTFPCAISNYSSIQPEWNTFDLSLGYNTGDMPENDYLKQLTVQLTVTNIAGIHAPFEYGPTSATRNPAAYSIRVPDMGRVVGLTLIKNW